MTENEIAKIIVVTAFRLHIKLGPGLLESVYEVILTYDGLVKSQRYFETIQHGVLLKTSLSTYCMI